MAADNGVQTTDGGRAGGGTGQVRGERGERRTPGCQGEKICSPRGAAEPGNNETILHRDRTHPPGGVGVGGSATRQRRRADFCAALVPRSALHSPPRSQELLTPAHIRAHAQHTPGLVCVWGGGGGREEDGSDKADFCRRRLFCFYGAEDPIPPPPPHTPLTHQTSLPRSSSKHLGLSEEFSILSHQSLGVSPQGRHRES